MSDQGLCHIVSERMCAWFVALLSLSLTFGWGCETSSSNVSTSANSSGRGTLSSQSNGQPNGQDSSRAASGAQTSDTLIESPSEPQPAIVESPFTLELELVARGASDATVRLHYNRRASQAAPRTAELFIEYPEELRVAQVTRLEATERAEKDLIVQHPSPGRMRLVWMAIGNLNTLDSGPLAEIKFQGRPAARDAVHILSLPDHPWFAPAAANEGILISEPLLFVSE